MVVHFFCRILNMLANERKEKNVEEKMIAIVSEPTKRVERENRKKAKMWRKLSQKSVKVLIARSNFLVKY